MAEIVPTTNSSNDDQEVVPTGFPDNEETDPYSQGYHHCRHDACDDAADQEASTARGRVLVSGETKEATC